MGKAITLTGSMAYPDDYAEMVRMLSEVDLSPAITHRFPLARFEEALDTARDAVSGKGDHRAVRSLRSSAARLA